MKFLKALGIGVATQLSVTILSVILLLAFCSVSLGGVSVILSGVVALGLYRLLYIPLLWFWDIFIAKKMWQRLCPAAKGFLH